MAQQLINGKQQFIDGNGGPLAGGSVAFYAPGTLNPVNTWQDQNLTILNANPIVLDANGMASIWGADGTLYRQIVTEASGTTLWDQTIGSAPVAGPTSSRPTSGAVGQTYFDTTLGQPIWCFSVSPLTWVNAAGVVV